MSDAFTLTVKTGAITRYAKRAGFKRTATIASYMAEIERRVALSIPLSEIKSLVVDMRGWAWAGPLDEWAWLDNRLDELAEYLSTDEERVSNRELVERLERSLLEASNR